MIPKKKHINRLLYQNKSNLREALRTLCDDGVILAYKNVQNKNRLSYEIEIEQGKPKLKFHCILLEEKKRNACKNNAYTEFFILNKAHTVNEFKERITNAVASRRIGWRVENRAIACIKELCGKNFGDFAVLRVLRALPSEDSLGNDLFIFVRHEGNEKKISLQVKRSKKGQEKHRVQHPYIPSMCMFEYEGCAIVEEMAVKIVRGFLKNPSEILHLSS